MQLGKNGGVKDYTDTASTTQPLGKTQAIQTSPLVEQVTEDRAASIMRLKLLQHGPAASMNGQTPSPLLMDKSAVSLGKY